MNRFFRTSSRIIAVYLALLFIKIGLSVNFNDDQLVSNIFGLVFLGAVLGGIIFLLVKVTGELPSPALNRKFRVFFPALAISLTLVGIPLLLYGIILIFVFEKDFLWAVCTLGVSTIMILFAGMSLMAFSKKRAK